MYAHVTYRTKNNFQTSFDLYIYCNLAYRLFTIRLIQNFIFSQIRKNCPLKFALFVQGYSIFLIGSV